MKLLLLIILTAISYHNNPSSRVQESPTANSDFKLHYMKVGLGNNMFRLQPVFVVENKEFVYTMEQVWAHPDQTDIFKDTLAMGKLRDTSIDSIINIVYNTKDSSISKSERFSSGSITYISIEAGNKKLKIDLFNASDSTAEKILKIIDTYMLQKFSAFDD